jgi:hypothetical protein
MFIDVSKEPAVSTCPKHGSISYLRNDDNHLPDDRVSCTLKIERADSSEMMVAILHGVTSRKTADLMEYNFVVNFCA